MTALVLAGSAGVVILVWAFIAWKRARDERRHLRAFHHRLSEGAARLEAERRAAFLQYASHVLALSPDYESTLAAVARLAVPRVADWCVVDLLRENGTVESVAMAHVDPAKVELIRELRRAYPIDPHAAYGVGAVLGSGRAIVYPEVPDRVLESAAQDVEQLKIARALGMQSAMAVPLLIGGRRLGVISFMTAESGRRFVPADLSFAEELAQRVAIAIDSARP